MTAFTPEVHIPQEITIRLLMPLHRTERPYGRSNMLQKRTYNRRYRIFMGLFLRWQMPPSHSSVCRAGLKVHQISTHCATYIMLQSSTAARHRHAIVREINASGGLHCSSSIIDIRCSDWASLTELQHDCTGFWMDVKGDLIHVHHHAQSGTRMRSASRRDHSLHGHGDSIPLSLEKHLSAHSTMCGC